MKKSILLRLRYIEGKNFEMRPVVPIIRRYPTESKPAPLPRSAEYCECHGVYQNCGYQDLCR